MKHKHYDLIVAWAGGAEIEYQTDCNSNWRDSHNPEWLSTLYYRVKPKPNKELLVCFDFDFTGKSIAYSSCHAPINSALTPNVKFTFDGETNGFLKVEKI